jgi:malonyl CoA-acyl carrier protein transacylase
VQSIQKWADTFGDLLKKQKQTLEAQYNGGLKIIEQALTVHTTKELEELRAKLIGEWKKNLEVQRQVAEAQMQALLTAQVEWVEDVSKVMTRDWDWWLVDMDAPFADR